MFLESRQRLIFLAIICVIFCALILGQMDEQLMFTSCNMGSACSPLWDVTIRQEVKQTKVSEKELNELRSKILVPGSKLDLGEDTSRIPILVIQRPGTLGT